MKRALGAIVFSLCFFFLCYSAALAETTTQVTIGPDVKGAKGSTVTIQVKVTGVPDPGIGSMKGSISYPADLLEIKESDITTTDRDNYLIVAAVDNGEIGFVFACFLRRCKTNGAIFQINAKVTGEDGDEGDLKIVFDEFRTAADPPENVASVAIVNGKFTVSSCTGTECGGPQCENLQAAFSVENTSGFNVTFKDKSSVQGKDCTIKSWSWDFGDGKKGSDQNPKHLYDKASCFTVTLTVTDSDNNTRTSAPQTVTVNTSLPKVQFSISPQTVNAGEPVTFDSTGSDAGTYEWNLGDNTKSNITEKTFKHVYFTSGKLTVTLKITNSVGCSNSDSKPITVNPPKRPLVRAYPNPFTSGSSITFNVALPQGVTSGKVKIFSMAGKSVKELTLSGTSASWSVPSDLPNGPYYFVVIAGGSASQVGKLVIHR
ncbi:PKD domain-containing protein [Candidatus Acetothermia bacterium]|nr:PKD domain-containing protein [Candidatus Acetothermia bacterium]MBI3461236.1 PKD domain-containing protein [Candidatus Acetothermia bacterium]